MTACKKFECIHITTCSYLCSYLKADGKCNKKCGAYQWCGACIHRHPHCDELKDHMSDRKELDHKVKMEGIK
jgi:hypothetical protein